MAESSPLSCPIEFVLLKKITPPPLFRSIFKAENGPNRSKFGHIFKDLGTEDGFLGGIS